MRRVYIGLVESASRPRRPKASHVNDRQPRFREVPARADFPALDARILAFWKDADIFAQEPRRAGDDAPVFVFYEGPPTANGRPGAHHVLSRIFKDIFPRYKTMRGYRVPRKAGWDTPRPAGRARGRAPPRHRRQGADRGVRRRRVQRALPRERARPTSRSGTGSPSASASGSTSTTPTTRSPTTTSRPSGGCCGASTTRGCSTRASRSCPTARAAARRSRATRSPRATRTSPRTRSTCASG